MQVLKFNDIGAPKTKTKDTKILGEGDLIFTLHFEPVLQKYV